MDTGNLSPYEEVRGVLRQLRNHLKAQNEMGIDELLFAHETLQYLGRSPSSVSSLADLRRLIGDCTRCILSRERGRLVFGEGSPRAQLIFVGEGPGREEDRLGRPFVGEAGKLLDRIVAAMGLTREQVYICNVVKCRPPKNRDPEDDEIETCIPFLRKQIELIQPKVLCLLGRVAGRALIGAEFSMSRGRGSWREVMGIPAMPTYHPAYLLRNPAAKRQVWDDVQQIMNRLGLKGKRRG
jgi:DNA polymerase